VESFSVGSTSADHWLSANTPNDIDASGLDVPWLTGLICSSSFVSAWRFVGSSATVPRTTDLCNRPSCPPSSNTSSRQRATQTLRRFPRLNKQPV